MSEPLTLEQLCKLMGVYPHNPVVKNIFDALEHNGYEIVKKEDTSNPLRAGRDIKDSAGI